MLKEKFISYCGITQEYGIHETIKEAEQELKENFRNPDYTADREDYIDGFIAEIKWTACTHTSFGANNKTIVEPQIEPVDDAVKKEKAINAFSKILKILQDDETRILLEHFHPETIDRLRNWLNSLEEKDKKEVKK